MTDGIIKGTGNSRFLKGPANAAALYPDFESFRDAWAAGTLPIDLNGINPAGWEVLGDKLNKSTLLTDALCTALSLPTTATPTQAMEKLRQLAQIGVDERAKIAFGSYIGTGKYGGEHKNTIHFPFEPKLVAVSCGVVGNGGIGTFVRPTNSVTVSITISYMSADNYVEWEGNDVTWWLYGANTHHSYFQLNGNGTKYYYAALG